MVRQRANDMNKSKSVFSVPAKSAAASGRKARSRRGAVPMDRACVKELQRLTRQLYHLAALFESMADSIEPPTPAPACVVLSWTWS